MKKPVPRIRFSGNDFAHDMGAVFAENLADLLAKVDDGSGAYPRGFIHTSTCQHPGTCYYDQVWARDGGRGLQELARLGFLDDARSVGEFFLSHKNFGDHWGRIVDRPIGVDYELDGNTHILNGLAETWRMSGRDPETGRRYVAACRDVFDWMRREMDQCPIGDMIPCISELAGNPCDDQPVYAIYPNWGAAQSMRQFARMAEECGLPGDAACLSALEQRLTGSICRTLVSDGGSGKTAAPAGVWLNGLTKDGKAYETANFDARFPIHHWTRQLPFIQNYDADELILRDDAAKAVHMSSYLYLRHEMAKGYMFRKYGFVSNTAWTGAGGRHDDTMCGYGQNYFTQAALMMDDVNTYGKCLEGIARLAYDGDVIEPMTYDMNPFILHECFEYDNYEKALDHTFGKHEDPARGVMDNPGDEGNLVQACEALKTLALAAGVAMRNGELIVMPRLPWRWDSVELTDFPVCDTDGTLHRISLTYRHDREFRHCGLTVTEPDGIARVRVRFGPFPAVVSTREDISRLEAQQTDGATFFWKEGGTKQELQL